jgi:hypothetical protein
VKIDRSLMESADTSDVPFSTASIAPQPAPPPLPGDEQSRYPWKRQIVTTTFWVGETPTHNNPVRTGPRTSAARIRPTPARAPPITPPPASSRRKTPSTSRSLTMTWSTAPTRPRRRR